MSEPGPSRMPHRTFRMQIGGRELFILALGGVPAMVCIFLPGLPAAWLPLRAGLAVLLGDIALVWALGRDPHSQDTLESKLLRWLTQAASARNRPEDMAASTGGQAAWDRESRWRTAWRPERPRPVPSEERPFAPIRFNSSLLLQVVSYAALAFLIVWLATGGTQEIMRWIHQSLR
jgi:hypothetical protein